MTRDGRLLTIGGAGALVAAWTGVRLDLAPPAFATHMAVHMIVVAVAAPLLALGVAGSSVDPVRRWPRLFAPVPISIADFVVVWTWHAPGLQDAARSHPAVWWAEQLTFLAAGLAIWLSAAGGDAEGRRLRAGGGIFALLFTSMHMTLLGVLFAVAPVHVYTGHTAVISPMVDQQIGGAIMIAAGGLSYLAGGLWLTSRLLGVVR
jgi:putative membrane protein